MTEERIATVRPVAEHEARGAVAEIFADIKRTKNIDFVPGDLAHARGQPHTARGRLVQPEERSCIPRRPDASPGSIPQPARSSPWPSRPPTAALTASTPTPPPCAKQGVDQETLGEIMAIVGLFNMTNALANGYQIEPDILRPTRLASSFAPANINIDAAARPSPKARRSWPSGSRLRPSSPG